jgi:hypothetical protein
MNTEAILAQRSKTHGDFHDNAAVSQALKKILRAQPGWELLTDIQREALDMNCSKVSRILSGQAHYTDHWDDIGGYARLASLEIEGEHRTEKAA